MRVLHINAVYGAGSTGIIVADIHEKSLQRGIESYVAYAFSPLNDTEIENSYVIGNWLDHKLHAILGRINGKQAYFSRMATKKMLHYIDIVQPDIIHLHNLHSNYINLSMLLEYLANHKISTIITLHDCWFYTGGCFHYTRVGCLKWLDKCGDCLKKKQDTPAYIAECSSKILKDRKKYFGKIQDLTVVGVSKWITDEARKTFFKNSNLLTIYNGVDLAFFKPVESDFREKYNLKNKFLILGMANKWLDSINKEELQLFTKYLEADSVLILVGCQGKQKPEFNANVLFLPYVHDRKKLREIYSVCDVLVNCTREESLSMINLEAQACGTPVVTYANTGVEETVDGICGYGVTTGNEKELFDAVMQIKKMGKRVYSDKCREFVLKKFNKDIQYNEYLKLYSHTTLKIDTRC